jgi:hypothetical protein
LRGSSAFDQDDKKWIVGETPLVAGGGAGEHEVLRLRLAIRFAYRQTALRMTGLFVDVGLLRLEEEKASGPLRAAEAFVFAGILPVIATSRRRRWRG